MSSAWRRREYLGGAHRPDLSFLCGTNGLRAVPLREAGEDTSGACKIEAAVAAGGIRDFWCGASSRTQNRLTARRDLDIRVVYSFHRQKTDVRRERLTNRHHVYILGRVYSTTTLYAAQEGFRPYLFDQHHPSAPKNYLLATIVHAPPPHSPSGFIYGTVGSSRGDRVSGSTTHESDLRRSRRARF
jgi:hypothetical protein